MSLRLGAHGPLLAYWLLKELTFSKALTTIDTGPAILSGSPGHFPAPPSCSDLPLGCSFAPFASLWGGSLTHLSEVGLQWEGERSRQRGCCNWFAEPPEDLPCTWRDTSQCSGYEDLWSREGTRKDTSYLTLPQTLLDSGSLSISLQRPDS